MGIWSDIGGAVGGAVNDFLGVKNPNDEWNKAQGRVGAINENNFGMSPEQFAAERARILGGGVGSQTAGNQQALANMYMQMASGQGPSFADIQARNVANQSMRQQASMAAGAAPQNAAMAARMAATNQGQAMGSIAGQSAAARVQEQQASMAGAGNLLQGMGQQDLQNQSQQNQALAEYYRQQLQGGLGREQLRADQMGQLYGANMSDPGWGQRLGGMAAGLMPVFTGGGGK